MRRYVVAAVVEAVVAALFLLVAVMMVAGGTFDPAEHQSGLHFFLALAAASAVAAVMAFRARDDARLRLAFLIVELLWVGCYALLLFGARPDHASTSSLMEATRGDDVLVRFALAWSVAAADAGAAIARRFIEILMAPHVVCLVLGLWGLLDGLRGAVRRSDEA